MANDELRQEISPKSLSLDSESECTGDIEKDECSILVRLFEGGGVKVKISSEGLGIHVGVRLNLIRRFEW